MMAKVFLGGIFIVLTIHVWSAHDLSALLTLRSMLRRKKAESCFRTSKMLNVSSFSKIFNLK